MLLRKRSLLARFLSSHHMKWAFFYSIEGVRIGENTNDWVQLSFTRQRRFGHD